MKLKKLLTICILLALCFSVLCFGFSSDTVEAASASSIFSGSSSNNSSMRTSTGTGLNAVFGTTDDTGFVKSANNIDLNKFAIEFTVASMHFEKLYFRFANVEDAEIGFAVTMEHVTESDVVSTKVSVYDFVDFDDSTATTEYTISGVTLDNYNFWLEYADGVLSIKTQTILQEGDEDYSASTTIAQYQDENAERYADFDWIEDIIGGWNPLKEANLEIGVLGQEVAGDDLGQDEDGTDIQAQSSTVNLISVSSYYGKQLVGGDLTVRPILKCNLREYRGIIIDENYAELETLLFTSSFAYGEGDDAIDVRAIELYGAQGASYSFPFYLVPLAKETSDRGTVSTVECYDYYFSSISLYIKETEGEWTKSADNAILASASAYSLDKAEGTQYAFVFEAKIDAAVDPENPEDNSKIVVNSFKFAVVVESIEDELKPEVNRDNFIAWTQSSDELKAIFDNTILYAPETGSYVFPAITKAVNDRWDIFSDKIGLADDESTQHLNTNFNNFSIVVGYKRDDSTSDYIYGSSTSVSMKSVGEWTFVYKVVDQSNNEQIIYTFKKIVQDITKPTIRVSTPTREIEIGNVLEVPTATRSDNCSGINSSLNKYTVYYLDYTAYAENGYPTDDDGNILFSQLTALEQSKIDEGFKITEDMKFVDTYGNTLPAFIVVYEATDQAGNHAVGTVYGYVKAVTPSATETIPNPVNEVLEIILIVVVALLFVSLLVLFFVNPTQKKRDARLEALATANEARMNQMLAENQAKAEEDGQKAEETTPAEEQSPAEQEAAPTDEQSTDEQEAAPVEEVAAEEDLKEDKAEDKAE